MGIQTKVVALDANGAGSTHVAPMYFVGASGVTHVDADGDDLGTALLKRGDARLAVGDVHVSGGSAHGEATLYFDCP
jgi:hypothetical protein